ncbi:MAG: hypothetical protein KDC75_22330, partial [Phaeodactylibacter sp.]|nr:hypothetical protein [Phaeodactylibacter sp.]
RSMAVKEPKELVKNFVPGALVSNAGLHAGPSVREGQLVTGFMICKAESRVEVESWSSACPILKHPHGSVEIRECSPFKI